MQTKSAMVIALAMLLSVATLCGTYLYSARGKKPVDQSDRYEVKEYNQGIIRGLALVDKKIGRVWLLTAIVDDKGKTVRDEFREAAVSELWDTEDSIPAHGTELSEYQRKMSYSIKELTRPASVTEADRQAATEPLTLPLSASPKSGQKPEK